MSFVLFIALTISPFAIEKSEAKAGYDGHQKQKCLSKCIKSEAKKLGCNLKLKKCKNDAKKICDSKDTEEYCKKHQY